jgi:uncharacterized membrane protein
MHPAHVAVSMVNLICGFAALLLLFFTNGTPLHTLASFAVVVGYVANLLAVAIALVLLVVLAVRFVNGQAQALLKSQWLGLFNGTFVVAFWGAVLLYGRLNAS